MIIKALVNQTVEVLMGVDTSEMMVESFCSNHLTPSPTTTPTNPPTLQTIVLLSLQPSQPTSNKHLILQYLSHECRQNYQH